ncbi:MAG: hypothetical protein GY703_20885 [Gammaproteobacteria bacterium]|nr:hypothetical protein [Gammaproteobacteria bacterium]
MMSIEIGSSLNGQIQSASDNSKVASAKEPGSERVAEASGSISGKDKFSMTSSASQMQALTEQARAMPVVDADKVSDVQRTMATTGLEFEPTQAAGNMLEQEKALAMLELQN